MIICGTDEGYHHHRRTGQPACRACLAAHSAYNRLRRTELSGIHGTPEGLRRHKRYGSPVCEPCLTFVDRLEEATQQNYLTQYRRTTAAMPLEEAS